MNRRQFLTGASAIAVASALPAQAVVGDFAIMQPMTLNGVPIVFDEGVFEGCSYHAYPGGFTLIPDWRSFCATGEELG